MTWKQLQRIEYLANHARKKCTRKKNARRLGADGSTLIRLLKTAQPPLAESKKIYYKARRCHYEN